MVLNQRKCYFVTGSTTYPALRSSWSMPFSPMRCAAPTTKRVLFSLNIWGI